MSCNVDEVTKRLENELCYVTTHELCSFSNLSFTSTSSQFILQPFSRFTYVTAHSPTLPLLHIRHSSFSKHSVTSPTSQLILQAFRHFTHVTVHSPTLPSLLLRHRFFTYVSWRAAHGINVIPYSFKLVSRTFLL